MYLCAQIQNTSYRDRNLYPYLKYNKDKIYIFAPSGNTSRQVKYEIISDTGVRSNIQRAVREKSESECALCSRNLKNVKLRPTV